MPKPDHRRVMLDKERTLFFSHYALMRLDEELEEHCGLSFIEWCGTFMPDIETAQDPNRTVRVSSDMVQRALSGYRYDVLLRAYRWALYKHEGEMTLEQVGDLLDASEMGQEDQIGNLIAAHPMFAAADGSRDAASGPETGEGGEPIPLERSGS